MCRVIVVVVVRLVPNTMSDDVLDCWESKFGVERGVGVVMSVWRSAVDSWDAGSYVGD